MKTISPIRRQLLAVLPVALCAPLLIGRANAAVEWGREYLPVKSPQPPEHTGKIDVVEFFSYGCPHCYKLEPVIAPWVAIAPGTVSFQRMPVVFQESSKALARGYFALETMGLLPRLHLKFFEALQEKNIPLSQEQTLFDWIGKQGVDAKRFADTYASFGIESKIKRARFLAEAYEINSVPTLVVGGKYQTSNVMAGSKENLPRVLDELVQLARQDAAASR
jgi:protein dithiol oxidoreductase (disulfide-forming)